MASHGESTPTLKLEYSKNPCFTLLCHFKRQMIVIHDSFKNMINHHKLQKPKEKEKTPNHLTLTENKELRSTR